MCDPVTLTLMSVGASAAASGLKGTSDIMAAKAETKATRLETAAKNAALQEEADLAYIESLQAVNRRADEARKLHASNLAYVATSGGTNRSFTQGIAPENQRVLDRDIASLRLNERSQRKRIADTIKLNKANVEIAKTNESFAYLNAGANLIGATGSSAISGIDRINTYGTGSSGTG